MTALAIFTRPVRVPPRHSADSPLHGPVAITAGLLAGLADKVDERRNASPEQ